eukprot:13822547-Alexandrium_andersonii.AAC.1
MELVVTGVSLFDGNVRSGQESCPNTAWGPNAEFLCCLPSLALSSALRQKVLSFASWGPCAE